MGNGESTARRISMQRSEEGVIQIHQDVMYRLNDKEDTSSTDPKELEGLIKVGDEAMNEEQFKAILKKAFEAGKAHQSAKFKEERERMGPTIGSDILPPSDLSHADKLWQRNLEEKEERLQQESERLNERALLIRERIEKRKKNLEEVYKTTAQEIQNRFKPLQNATICQETKEEALKCFQDHATQPLKCSELVKNFTKCVEETRMKTVSKIAN